MSVGEEKKIFVFAFHCEGEFIIHHGSVECGKKFGAAESSSGMTGIDGVNHS